MLYKMWKWVSFTIVAIGAIPAAMWFRRTRQEAITAVATREVAAAAREAMTRKERTEAFAQRYRHLAKCEKIRLNGGRFRLSFPYNDFDESDDNYYDNPDDFDNDGKPLPGKQFARDRYDLRNPGVANCPPQEALPARHGYAPKPEDVAPGRGSLMMALIVDMEKKDYLGSSPWPMCRAKYHAKND